MTIGAYPDRAASKLILDGRSHSRKKVDLVFNTVAQCGLNTEIGADLVPYLTNKEVRELSETGATTLGSLSLLIDEGEPELKRLLKRPTLAAKLENLLKRAGA